LNLWGVKGATYVQIHVANKPSELKGCFAAGQILGNDFVGNSGNAMDLILGMIAADGTGNISVVVN
jgi:hypothetical protein